MVTRRRANPYGNPAFYPSNIDSNYLVQLNGLSLMVVELRSALSVSTQDYHAAMMQHGSKSHRSGWWQHCKSEYCTRHLQLWKNAARFEPTKRQRLMVQKNADKRASQRAEELTRRVNEQNSEQIGELRKIMEGE